jgi:hypothetical protein
MSEHKFLQLREGQPGCPSDLALDRLFAGELKQPEAGQLTAHVESCAVCPARMAARTAGFGAFAEVDSRPLLAAIRRRAAEPEKVSAPLRWLRNLGLVLTPLAAAAALMIIFLIRRGGPDSPGPEHLDPNTDSSSESVGTSGTRMKGDLTLRVYRLAEDHAELVKSGTHLMSGDRLRFVVDLPQKGQVAILGIETNGTLYTAWPTGTAAKRRYT